jgi:hypothetical protein
LTTDSRGQIHLQYGIEAFDSNGLLVKKLNKDLHGAPGSSNTVNVSVWLDIPAFIPPGASKLSITAHDVVKNTGGEIVAPFIVEAPSPAVSRKLEIRDLRFSLSENGPPLDPPVIHPGTTLYVSGKLAGMRFQDDRIDVGFSFQVVDPGGEVILDRPSFLDVKDSFPYHPSTFYVPITAHLNLPADAPVGTYKERYVVTDRIGGATRTYELTFELEQTHASPSKAKTTQMSGAAANRFVLIVSEERAYTVYMSVPTQKLAEIKGKASGRADTEIVSWESFVQEQDRHINSHIVKNDYPEHRVTDGLLALLASNEGSPIGLTWNSGIAITYNDYRHAKRTYLMYQNDASEYERTRNADPRADPVHPRAHFDPLLGDPYLSEHSR